MCCFSFNAHAQKKISFVGDVRDTNGTPLQFANILAMDTVNNTIAGFGVTDPNGQFRLSLENDKVYRLKVSFIGFIALEAIITATDNRDLPLSITLEEGVKALDGVEVVSEMAVLIQGDTITYKADVFAQRQ